MFLGPEVFTAVYSLAACDSCGDVVVAALAGGWRSFTHTFSDGSVRTQHHCPGCVEHNEHIRSGLVYKTDPAAAVSYDS